MMQRRVSELGDTLNIDPNGYDKTIEDIAEFFKIISDPTRVKLLFALSAGELCVQELMVVLDASSSRVSHQLSTLRAAKIVKQRREGKYVHYSLDDKHIEDIIKLALEHYEHN